MLIEITFVQDGGSHVLQPDALLEKTARTASCTTKLKLRPARGKIPSSPLMAELGSITPFAMRYRGIETGEINRLPQASARPAAARPAFMVGWSVARSETLRHRLGPHMKSIVAISGGYPGALPPGAPPAQIGQPVEKHPCVGQPGGMIPPGAPQTP
jgi:hypothetical protein